MGSFTKYKWRLYADNNIEKEIVDFLRQESFDILWVTEEPELQRQQEDRFHYQKARQLGRYLLTDDMDFWNDRKFPLKESPGVIIVSTQDISAARELPAVFRLLLMKYNPYPEPIYLDGIKVKLSGEGIVMKFVDQETQKKTTDSWTWEDLIG